jgi:hypothetical protein
MNDDAAIGTTISLPQPPIGWFDYAYAVLMDDTLALLRADLDIRAEYERWQAQMRSNKHAPQPRLWDGRARLSTFDGSVESKAIEMPLGFSPVIDRLADGRWLLAASRAAQGEANGRLYAPDGTPAGALVMGDGIEHVRCAADGTVWVGYFDEGIFSGPNEDGTWPISSSGIARFAPDGTVQWRFNTAERADLFIADSYALALDGNTLWSCFYTNFPIVCIDGEAIRRWSNDVTGARALAIDADYVLLAGGYDDKAGRIALVHLDEERARYLGELNFQPLPRGAAGLVQGQCGTLHIIRPGSWTRVDVRTVRTALGA